MTELEKLKAQNLELNDRIAKLEAAAKPAEPFKSDWKGPMDYTQGASMPPQAMLDLMKAVPDSLMRELRADAMKPNPIHASSSTVSGTPSAQPPRRNTGGWIEERPLESPPGIEHCDRLMDAQDKIDRVELVERELKLARMGKGDAG